MTDDELTIWPLYPPDVVPPDPVRPIDQPRAIRTDAHPPPPRGPVPFPDGRPSPAPSTSEPPTSRRAALTRAGAVLAGAGVLGLGAAAVGRRFREPAGIPRKLVNVIDHGALGDGAADDTAGLQRAIDAARPTGGTVFLPPGTYRTDRLSLHSGVHLRGAGGDATTLTLRTGPNRAIVETAPGASRFSVRDLTLDGNQAGGDGLRLSGDDYEVGDVVVFNCRGDGIAGDGAGPHAARFSGVRAHNNDGHGINLTGPAHATFVDCLAFENGRTGFRLAGQSTGAALLNCHGWGVRQDISFDLAAPAVRCVNCYADLNGGTGVRIAGNDIQWIGGVVLGANYVGPGGEVGVRFVKGERPGEPAGCVIDTKIINCGTAAVDFGADGGFTTVRASVSGVRGKNWIGMPAASTQVDLTYGLANGKNLVVEPAFDLRVQDIAGRPGAGSVRVFARKVNGATQLCVAFPSGAVQVLAGA
jgi:hypothetical protein